jgi:hypothetical protein
MENNFLTLASVLFKFASSAACLFFLSNASSASLLLVVIFDCMIPTAIPIVVTVVSNDNPSDKYVKKFTVTPFPLLPAYRRLYRFQFRDNRVLRVAQRFQHVRQLRQQIVVVPYRADCPLNLVQPLNQRQYPV